MDKIKVFLENINILYVVLGVLCLSIFIAIIITIKSYSMRKSQVNFVLPSLDQDNDIKLQKLDYKNLTKMPKINNKDVESFLTEIKKNKGDNEERQLLLEDFNKALEEPVKIKKIKLPIIEQEISKEVKWAKKKPVITDDILRELGEED